MPGANRHAPHVVSVSSVHAADAGPGADLSSPWEDVYNLVGTENRSLVIALAHAHVSEPAENLPRALGDRDVAAAYVGRDSSAPADTPAVMTMHRSKGMEFAKVILVGIGEKSLPRGYLTDGAAR